MSRSDLIGDTPHIPDPKATTGGVPYKDRYPLMERWPMSSQFENVKGASAISNSSITDFTVDTKLGEIRFNIATNASDSCRLIISKWVLDGAINLLIDDIPATWSIDWSSGCRMITFTHSIGNHSIKIMGEYKHRCTPECPDVNRDGIIDIFDIVLLTQNFGKTAEEIMD